ncbi:hypothetical protein ODZ84_05570 [Chryseobacterium fluminis]|uniref:hypothetical protein n=1 Tax=Chryseobacterium fluminis TaxID=2983606 RepID=UPI00225B2876|nr:hypothetical protein [Chryseobacterium sp. MMS21-Ot14]UZT99041.1 hypothetical protein ODZ84_05570 [Chryseobacterium sp. MMS21-Ot14]
MATNAIDQKSQGINCYYKNVRFNTVITEIAKEIKEYQADLLMMALKMWFLGIHCTSQ